MGSVLGAIHKGPSLMDLYSLKIACKRPKYHYAADVGDGAGQMEKMFGHPFLFWPLSKGPEEKNLAEVTEITPNYRIQVCIIMIWKPYVITKPISFT